MPSCQRRTAMPAEMLKLAHLGLDQGKGREGELPKPDQKRILVTIVVVN